MLSSDLSSGELASVRAELLTYLTHVLMGDSLAAEYLILHLISNVYGVALLNIWSLTSFEVFS